MVTARILPFRENSHGRTGNRNRDLMISRQRLWPLDHEAGRIQNVCFDFLYNFEELLVSRRTERDMIKNVYWSSCKVLYKLLLSNFNKTWIFSRQTFEKTQISHFLNIRPVGAELFHVYRWKDGQTNGQMDRHDEADSRFSQFCKRA